MARFHLSMKRRYLARGTIKARMSVARRWLEFAGDDWPTATGEQVEAWLDTLALDVRTRYYRISHVQQFYRWAQREGLATSNPCELIERPRLPRLLPRPARSDLVTLALAEAPLETAIMLSLMVDAGLRCGEVATLDWSQVDLASGRMQFVGKGGRERVVGMPRRLIETLARSNESAGPVVGRAVTAGRVSQIVGKYLRDSGVGATAHQLRHLYATRMLEAADGNLLAVQQSLGHASVTSTQIYALVNPMIAIDAARAL
jgi:integrase/recombinase XerC